MMDKTTYALVWVMQPEWQGNAQYAVRSSLRAAEKGGALDDADYDAIAIPDRPDLLAVALAATQRDGTGIDWPSYPEAYRSIVAAVESALIVKMTSAANRKEGQ